MREWISMRKGRLAAGLAFLALSLGLFAGVNAAGPSAPVRVARRYMDAAVEYDYQGMYALMDQAVLDREMERAGLDRQGVEALAASNRDLVEQYVEDLERNYDVAVSWDYAVGEEQALDSDQLEALTQRYDFDLDVRAARRVAVRATVTLTGAEEPRTMERELSLVTIQTPRGWSLEPESLYAFEDLLFALPYLAQEAPDT